MDKISLRRFLSFSPYDNRYAYSQTLNINDFKKIRIIPKDFQDEKENLRRIIDPASDKSFYILSGYSGNGKTTFVHWFKEQIEEENYYFEIINLIEKGNDNKNEALMSSCLKDKVSDLLLDKNVLSRISENRTSFSATPISFTHEQLQEINKALSNEKFDKESANYLLEVFNFKQILILFLLHRIIQFVEDDGLKDKKSYTFCFDNLDELELEYLTPDMWQTVLDVSSLMQNVLIISKITGFEFAIKVKFVLVFREANIAVASAQLNDRTVSLITNRRFILTPFIGQDIIQNRINEYNKQDCNKDDKQLIDLLEIIINERITDYIILPLFNYDYRRFITATLEIITPEFKNGQRCSFIDLTNINYSAIAHDLKYGKRGILINAYVKYLAKHNYLRRLADIRELDKKACHCNKIRLMLTIFSNLSYQKNGFSIDERELHEAKPNEFTLLRAYEACKELFTTSDFFNRIVELIDIDKSSWAHLITVYGKEPQRDGKKHSFDFTEEEKILDNYKQTNRISYNDLNKINNISFSLNASSYIYLRHLLPHFEYMSAYKTRKDGILWHKMKPLFQLTDFNVQEMKWEFQIKLDEVLEHVSTYKENIQNHFVKYFINDTDIKTKDQFVQSIYVFKGDITKAGKGNVYPLYMTRLITSHIGYIETFRHYITADDVFTVIQKNIETLDEQIRHLTMTTKDEIHIYLLTIIEKYLTLLIEINDPTQSKIQSDLKSALEKAKKSYANWVDRSEK